MTNYPSIEHYLSPVQVTANSEISPDVFLLSWERTESFKPGQEVKLALDPEMPPRIYTICSGDKDKYVSILFDLKRDGLLTPRLSMVKPGGKILVSRAYGSFTCDRSPAFWIATGTGIAPFYSMLRSGLAVNKTLVHGVRFLNQFYFREECEYALGDKYYRCCSYEAAAGVFKGRITEFISNGIDLPPDFKYYLCGGGMMVVEVRDMLIEKGVPFENILSEIYF
jgi:ferredoxin--NADP+ reductase